MATEPLDFRDNHRPLVLGLAVPVIIGGLLVWAFHSWRIASFPHAIATVQETWTVQVPVGRRSLFTEQKYETITKGRIRFIRSAGGRSYDCEVVVTPGVPDDQFKVGQKLDVVPAKSTCSRVDVVGRAHAP